MIVGIIFIQEGTRRIPIVSARQLGKGQSQSKTSYLPLRLNQGGVMPIIFASAILSATCLFNAKLVKNQFLLNFLRSLISYTLVIKIFTLIFYFSLILFFSYFYASLIHESKRCVAKPKENGI